MLMHLCRLACIHSTPDRISLVHVFRLFFQENMCHIEGPAHGIGTAIRCWLICSWYQLKTCLASGMNITSDFGTYRIRE